MSVAELIAVKQDEMPAGERRAAQTLIANYPLIGLNTVAEFSAQAGVSAPTILRFVARLGFQNYAEFQAALRDELAAQFQSPLSRAGASRHHESGRAKPFVATTLDNITETSSHLSDRQLADIVGLLANPRARIVVAGGRFTDALARYMAAHLTLIRPGVHHLAGQESVWRDRLVDLGRKDVLIAFDIRRYQDSLLHFAGAMHARGGRIILFTDQWLSPIARFAAHVVAGRTGVPSPWDSSAALFVMAELVIAELTRHLGEAGAKRLHQIEQLRGSQAQ
jgi:DNA-binding MurR/RpiR family transcriptional regulator